MDCLSQRATVARGLNREVEIRVHAGVGESRACESLAAAARHISINAELPHLNEQRMDSEFWHARWDAQDIGFHQPAFEPALDDYWHLLNVAAGARVFVPLSGKSLDMVWLAQQGYHVVGSELSERAVDDFFAERSLTPTARSEGPFIIKSSGPYEIWCGDFFALPQSAVADVGGVYDRAALIALPADMQLRYANKMKSLLPAKAPIILIAVDYNQSEMPGPPFATPKQTVERLFSDRYECTQLVAREVLSKHEPFRQRGLTSLRGAVYLLRPR
jgi:thiopurine S-methyltransferase